MSAVASLTARSIFSLQRTRQVNAKLPPFLVKNNAPHWETIESRYKAISADMQGANAARYEYTLSWGNQEFVEALSFQHYLETQTLLPYADAQARVAALGGAAPILLPPADYVLGVLDMTGELMRFAITAMATTGRMPAGQSPSPSPSDDAMDVDAAPRTVLDDLRELRQCLEMLQPPRKTRFADEMAPKVAVMGTSVQKVETALYGLTVRGMEQPVS